MMYLGGKHRLAKKITAAIRAEVGGLRCWEPFCGGLSMTVELAKGSDGIASDAHPALMHMYVALRAGWDPPDHVSEEEYRAARNLPDADPLKAFCGFGCSFGGKWFGGYARDPRPGALAYAAASRRRLLAQIPATRHWTFARASFFDQRPCALDAFIYADPPYANTAGYTGVGAFDSAAFWARCQEWRAQGTRVFVSEFRCPIEHRVVLDILRPRAVAGSTGTVIDYLYEVL